MAEAVISGIAEGIVVSLGSLALENVGKLWGVKRELEELKEMVLGIQAELDDAEEQYYQSDQIKDWVKRLKDALFDALYVLTKFDIEAMRRDLRGHNVISKELRTFFSSSNQLALNWKMRYKVRVLQERIKDIMVSKEFNLKKRLAGSGVERPWTRIETHSFIHEGDIKGRDNDKEAINKFLFDFGVQENVSVLPIVGTVGIGKTALAKCVFNNKMVNFHFQLKMWICVSDNFDEKKIVRNMIACIKIEEPVAATMEWLQEKLREEIDGKRYLLVLDDWWSERQEQWLSLRRLLSGGARGSKILITTRLPSVAMIINGNLFYSLKELSTDASVDILMGMVCQNEKEVRDPKLLAIVKDIASQCYGVPLVIRIVGGLLYGNSESKWIEVRDHALPNLSRMEDDIVSTLRLSYDHLPSHLKQCFAFCSLFPKNCEINKRTLINLWVAEGFIRSSNGSQRLEDIAHKYFMDLIWRNFFQDFQKDPFTNKETCRMPALMHDLACSVAGTEHWVAGDDPKEMHARTYRICDKISSLIGGLPNSCSRLTTFLSTPAYREIDQREEISEANLRQLIASFKRLCILDLHAAIVQKVPRSICKLELLTYLDLSHNNALKRLPNSITRLHNLQTLNLQGCFALKELPRGIRKLVKLRNLDIDYCYSLSYLPRGLAQLSDLHMLTRFILPNGQALAKNYCRLKELNALNNIRERLCIENLGSVINVKEESRKANLIAKESLESLALKWGNFDANSADIGDRDKLLLNGLRPHSNLKKLMINRYKGESFPSWMMDRLVISLPSLVEVRFYFCGRCEHLPPLSLLPNLETLELWGLTELAHIESCGPSTSAPPFPKLLQLKIHHCIKLKDMPLTPHLEGLTLREVDGGLVKQIIGLNKLKSLHISQIKTLRCLPEKCLESLTSLERLSIGECEELDLSKDERDNILDSPGLKNLQHLRIHGLPKLASLPPWLMQASNLKHLSIKECFILKELPEQMDALQPLKELEIIRCPLLTSLPESMRRLHSLSHLKIEGCPKLEERCKKDTGADWHKISHIQRITHKLKYYEHRL